jgi:hypothetical protein
VAGSTLVENQAVDTTDLPMTTGASDAKTAGEMFSWMALLSGGVFPHYAGMGDAYRLATATAMEAPIQRQFSRYQQFWSAQFRKMLRIVLQMKEKYGGVSFSTYEAEVSTDKLVEVDLDGMSQALGRVFETIINPMSEIGAIPGPVVRGVLQAALTTVLQALGVDAEQVVGDEAWLEEGGPGSGWFAPPKGTHVGKEKKAVGKQLVPQSNLQNLTLENGFHKAKVGKVNATRFMYNSKTRTLLAGKDAHSILKRDYADDQNFDDFVKMVVDYRKDITYLTIHLDRVQAKSDIEAWNKCFDAAKVMRSNGFPPDTQVMLSYYSGKTITQLGLGEL